MFCNFGAVIVAGDGLAQYIWWPIGYWTTVSRIFTHFGNCANTVMDATSPVTSIEGFVGAQYRDASMSHRLDSQST